MAMWGSKAQYVDQCIADNGLEHLGHALADLLRGSSSLEASWDAFRSKSNALEALVPEGF